MLKLSGLFLFAVLISGAAFSSSFAFAQIGPIVEDDFYSLNEDTLLSVNPSGVLTNDTNIDNSFIIILNTNVGFGTLALNLDGSFTYLPNPNFNSIDSFTYIVTNGTHTSNNATVTLSVNAVNDAPIAQNNTAITLENTAVIIPVLNNDSDVDGDPLTIISVTQGTSGTVTTNGTIITYTPNLNFHGLDSFTYRISDGLLTAGATVSVTISSVNDAPIAQNNTAITLENTAVIIPVLNNDSDVDGDPLTIISVTQGTSGTVTTNGTIITYTPNLNFHGLDSFTYRISDGLNTSNLATVTVTVTSIDNENNSSKVDICHKGKKTISVSENAISAHLKHGDILGTCDNHEQSSNDKQTIKNQLKALTKEFKANGKELKYQLKNKEK